MCVHNVMCQLHWKTLLPYEYRYLPTAIALKNSITGLLMLKSVDCQLSLRTRPRTRQSTDFFRRFKISNLFAKSAPIAILVSSSTCTCSGQIYPPSSDLQLRRPNLIRIGPEMSKMGQKRLFLKNRSWDSIFQILTFLAHFRYLGTHPYYYSSLQL